MSAPVREQHPARLTHTSTASGVSARTQSLGHTQTQTHVAPLRRDGRLVRLVVWWMRVWQTVSAAMRWAWRWRTRSVTAAGLLIVLAATVGIAVGVAFGWVEWIVAGAAAGALLLLAVPFLFGANAYEVDLSMSDARVVAGSTVTGEIVVRNRGRGVALPGRIDIPVGDGLIELGAPLLLPRRAHAETLPSDAPRRGGVPRPHPAQPGGDRLFGSRPEQQEHGGEHGWHQHARRHALQHAEAHQRGKAGAEGAGDRGEGEEDGGEDHQLPQREHPHQQAGQRDGDDFSNQVGCLDPAHPVRADAQRLLDHAERGDDDLDIQHRHEHGDAEAAEAQPLPGFAQGFYAQCKIGHRARTMDQASRASNGRFRGCESCIYA